MSCELFYDDRINPDRNVFSCASADSLCLTALPEAPDASGQVEYPDDFEEAELEDEYEDEAALVHAAAPQQPHDDPLEEEFQLCDAGGLTVTLKALKEKG